MFPDEFFVPLVDKKTDIQQSDYIVLSVGGNDVREFLLSTFEQSEDNRQAFIKRALPRILEHLTENYLEIIRRIRAVNPAGQIIIMTQYYPSASQHTYNIYEFMTDVGKALDIGGDQHDPMDVIQHLVAETFRGIISRMQDENIVVADVTSSLNPFDNKNHTSQIEPSGHGGLKIAKILQHLITGQVTTGQIYRFTPAFFDEQSTSDSVISEPISNDWKPLHPRAIDAAEAEHRNDDVGCSVCHN